MRSPTALRHRIVGPMRLRAWHPVRRARNARPWRFVARGVSLRAFAAGRSSFQARPFLRIGTLGVARRSTMAVRRRRASWAPSIARQGPASREDRTVAVAPEDELDRPNCERALVDGRMDLAPPSAALHAMLARLPRAVAEELDAGAVSHPAGHRAVMSRKGTSGRGGPSTRRYGVGRPGSSVCGAGWRGSARACAPPAAGGSPPCPWPAADGRVESASIERQNRIAASDETAGPGRAVVRAGRTMSSSTRIDIEPRLRGAASWLDPFVVRYRAGGGVRMRPSQPHGSAMRVVRSEGSATMPRAGFDDLDGGRGSDILLGDDQADSLIGGDGNDVVRCDDGHDPLTGGQRRRYDMRRLRR